MIWKPFIMGNHVATFSNRTWTRFRTFRLMPNESRTKLRVGAIGVAWPVVAKRLEIQGHLGALEHDGNYVLMSSKLNESDLKANLQRHRKVKPARKIWIIIPSLMLIAIISCIPLGEEKHAIEAHPAIQIREDCDTSLIGSWLLGEGDFSYLKLGKSSSLGGVVVGTLECKGERYSYTLGSRDPKRVLNLRKLDS